jgi:integrase
VPRPLKSTAKLWPQSKTPGTKYRDRKRVTLPDGERKEMFGYGPTKQAATEDLYAKVEAAVSAHPQAQTITVTQLFAEFLQHKRSVKGNKAKTTFNDIKDFRLHIAPSIGHKPVSEITLADLQALQYKLINEGKYRTAELVTISLKSFFAYAVKRYRDEIEAGLRLRNVAADLDPIKRPPSTKSKPQLWTIDQLQAFLALAQKRYESSRRVLMYPLFYAALSAGLRRGELLGLKQSALVSRIVQGRSHYLLRITEQLVHYDKKHHHDTPKTAMGARDVPIDAALAQVLNNHMVKLAEVARVNPDWKEHGLMFPSYNGTPLEPSNIYRSRDEIIEALGLPHSTLHQMRKVYASYVSRNMIRKGTFSPKKLQALLGHSSPDTAIKIYTQIIEDDTEGMTFDPLATVAGMSAGMTSGLEPKEEDEEA